VQRWLKDEFGAEAFVGQWIRYVDLLGPGWAEIDAYIVRPEVVVVCEVKLTQQSHAFYQMESRYVPLLRFIYQRPVVMLQICKHLVEKIPPHLKRLPTELLIHPQHDKYTCHWIGG
jgi:hypothetical protein